MLIRRLGLLFPIFAATALAAGCSPSSDPTTDDSDLTSLTARSRKLTFEGVVYVAPEAKPDDILGAARQQTQTAFGALLNAKVSVRDRELHDVDPATFQKRQVTVIDTKVAGDAGKPMLEVRYLYDDDAVVPVALAEHSSLSLGLLAHGGDGHSDDVLHACTPDDKETRDDIVNGFLWYDFNPNKASCRKAMADEQRAIDDAEANLTDATTMVSKMRIDRIYLPTTMRLERQATMTGGTYPEYDKLWSGGVEKDALVIGLVEGRLSHEHVTASKDDGYPEWMTTLDRIFKANPDFVLTKIEPNEDLTTSDVNGHKYTGLTFQNFIDWTLTGAGWPQGMPPGDRDNIKVAISHKLDSHWITFEKKVNVTINGASKDFTIKLKTFFGAEEDPTPHQQAIKSSDVVVYNGHSYIGYGPLDPDNFKADSFPPSYQLFFFDSCVSYNYYEKDFFTLKPGGSKNLDIITNALESPEELSGHEEGDLIVRLIDGSMPSYADLLEAAKNTDSLRVVDGELDNTYSPSTTKIRVVGR